MSNTDPRFRGPGILPVLLLLLLTGVPAGLSAAQEPPPEPPAPEARADAEAPPQAARTTPEASPEETALRRRVEESYEVLPVRGGLVLQPREDFRGVRSIEITGSDLLVNGRSVDPDELRAWMGGRADAVLDLADFEPAERLRLFEVEAPAPGAEDGEDRDEDVAVEADDEIASEDDPEERADRRELESRTRRVHRGSPTVVGSSVRIAADEIADDVTVLGGSIDIEGRVDGDVTAFGGAIDIEGEVRRDVTAIGGNVHLGEDSEVGGEVTSVGGRVDREPGARVRGGINEGRGWERGWHGPVWPGADWRWGWNGPDWSAAGWVTGMIWPIVEVLFLALLVLLIVAVGRPTVERVGTRAGHEPVKSGIVGALVAILFFPAFIVVAVLLAISIIGIPILVILVLFFVFVGLPAFLVAALVGYSAVAWRLGKWTETRFGWRLESAFMAALVGLFFLHVLDLVGQALDIGPLRVFAVMFLFAAWVVQLVAWTIGFGALVMELYDRRQRRRGALVAGHPPGTVPPPPGAAPPPPAPPAAPPAPPPAEGTE